jgi:hypothetical protein
MGRTHDNMNYHGQYDDHGRISDKAPLGTWRGGNDCRPTPDHGRHRPDNGLDGEDMDYYRDTPTAMSWDNLGKRRIIEYVY